MTAKSFEEWWFQTGDSLAGARELSGLAWNASRAALLADTDVAGLVERLSEADDDYSKCGEPDGNPTESSLRDNAYNYGFLYREARTALESLAAQNAALRERLEMSDEHSYDGIATRDQTIRLQDVGIAKLKAQVDERDAEIARLKMENSKLRSALEIVHFKQEPWQ